jgi:hypothetical protein
MEVRKGALTRPLRSVCAQNLFVCDLRMNLPAMATPRSVVIRWACQKVTEPVVCHNITSGRAGSPVLQCGEESSFSNFSCLRL